MEESQCIVYDSNKECNYILNKIMRDDKTGIYKDNLMSWRFDKKDKYGNLTELSPQLNKKSRILNFFAMTWPINGIVHDFYLNEKGNICIRYEDHLGQTIHFYPFKLDKESEWLAEYSEESKTWNLTRLRFV